MSDQVKRGSRRNFFMVDNGIFDERLELDPLDKLVYICLLRYADNTTREAFPGMQRIANDIGIKRNRVNKAIKRLQEKELLEKRPRYDKLGAQKSNNYIVYDANEVINKVYPQNTGGVSSEYRGCISGIQEGVSQGYTKKTHLKIHKEEEAFIDSIKNKNLVKVDFEKLKSSIMK